MNSSIKNVFIHVKPAVFLKTALPYKSDINAHNQTVVDLLAPSMPYSSSCSRQLCLLLDSVCVGLTVYQLLISINICPSVSSTMPFFCVRVRVCVPQQPEEECFLWIGVAYPSASQIFHGWRWKWLDQRSACFQIFYLIFYPPPPLIQWDSWLAGGSKGWNQTADSTFSVFLSIVL